MFKTLKVALVSMLALSAPALAEAPWERPAPKMSAAQRDSVAQIHKVLVQNNMAYPGRDVNELGFQFEYVHAAPISNVTSQNLTKLLNGKYWVYSLKGVTAQATDNIQVSYFSGNQVFTCNNLSGLYADFSWQKWQYKAKKWSTLRNFSGFAGYADGGFGAGAWGYPAVYDAAAGDFATYTFNDSAPNKKKVWFRNAGHLQSDYAAVFAKICPNLPNNGRANEAQTATDYTTFRKQAGGSVAKNAVPVIYRANVRAPVTLGMYYSSFPAKLK